MSERVELGYGELRGDDPTMPHLVVSVVQEGEEVVVEVIHDGVPMEPLRCGPLKRP